MNLRAMAGSAAIVVAVGASLVAGAPAHALAGGDTSNAPWVVDVYSDTSGKHCTGTALGESWILSARHCGPMELVKYPTGRDGAYDAGVRADRTIGVPQTDLELIHLASPHPLSTYPTTDLGYYAKAENLLSGDTYGNGQPTSGTQKHKASPIRGSAAFGGDRADRGYGFWVYTEDVDARPGDSGGPFIVNGRVAGVSSVAGDGTTYANLFQAPESSVALVNSKLIGEPTFADGRVTVPVGVDIVAEPDTRLVAFVNGTASELAAFVSPGTNVGSVDFRIPATLGDLVQIVKVPRSFSPDRPLRVGDGSVQLSRFVGEGDFATSHLGVYAIRNVNSGQILDVNGGTVAQGAEVIQYPNVGSDNQQWTFRTHNGYTQLVNQRSSQVLAISGGLTNPGQPTIQWAANGGAEQDWRFHRTADGHYTIENANSHLVLAVAQGSTSAGARAIQWTDTGAAEQKWDLVKLK